MNTDSDSGAVYYHTGQGYKIQIGKINGDQINFNDQTYRAHYTIGFPGNGEMTVTDKYGNQDVFTAMIGFNAGMQEFSSVQGSLVKSTDKDGNELDYTRDANNNIIKIEDPAHGRYVVFTLDPVNHLVVAATDSFGRTVGYSYDSNLNLTQVVLPATASHPLGTTFSYAYDSYNRLMTEVDGNGNTILSNVWGTVAKVYWNATSNGFVPVYVDSDGNPVTAHRVMMNQVASQTYNGSTCSLTYQYNDGYEADLSIRCLTNSDVRGYATDYYNDGNGDIVEKVVHTAGLHPGEPASYTTQYFFDTSGKTYDKIGEIEPDGGCTVWTYDGNHNVLTTSKYPHSVFTTGPVDLSTGLASIVVSAGQASAEVTTYTYEPRFNQVASVTDANGNETTYDYGTAQANPGGDLLSVTYPVAAAGTGVSGAWSALR